MSVRETERGGRQKRFITGIAWILRGAVKARHLERLDEGHR
jgi:hypothetical protein